MSFKLRICSLDATGLANWCSFLNGGRWRDGRADAPKTANVRGTGHQQDEGRGQKSSADLYLTDPLHHNKVGVWAMTYVHSFRTSHPFSGWKTTASQGDSVRTVAESCESCRSTQRRGRVTSGLDGQCEHGFKKSIPQYPSPMMCISGHVRRFAMMLPHGVHWWSAILSLAFLRHLRSGWRQEWQGIG